MLRVAIAMLVRERGRFYGLVIALGFTAFILTQQPSTLLGVIGRTTALIEDMRGVDVWVMDPLVRYSEDAKALPDGALFRVRGVPGVASAAPFFKGSARARLADGRFQNCELYGVDDATLVGVPARLLGARATALREADAIFVDRAGARMLAGASGGASGAGLRVGDVLELDDARARVAGFYDAPPGFQTLPRVYTTWQRVRRYAPAERRTLSFVLVRVAEGADAAAVARAITARTGLRARTAGEFADDTRRYFLANTGVLVTFYLITVIAVLIGLFIAAQTFRNFVLEHLRHFGALAAMGTSYRQLVRMVMAQALVAGAHGTGLGLGLAAITNLATASTETGGPLALWQVLATTVLMLAVCAGVAALSVRRIRRLEPAAVFRS